MPAPIIHQDMSGIAQGITQAGSVLGQALGQRTEQQKEEAQRISLAKQFGEDTVLGKILSQPGGLKIAQQLGPIIGPMIKTQEAASGIENIKSKWEPIDPSTQQQVQPEQVDSVGIDMSTEGPPTPAGVEPKLSPIGAVNQSIKEREVSDKIIADESPVVTTPSGVFPKKDMIKTPFGDYHPQQLKEYANSPYPALNREAKMVQEYLLKQEEVKGAEGAQIRKENRQQISAYSKDYIDTRKTKGLVRQLYEAKKLIKSGKVSLNDNWVRNAAVAVLNNQGLDEVAELAKTPEQRRLYSLIYNSLRTKDLGGSNPSTKEVLLSLAAKPSALKGEEENLAILDDLILDAEGSVEKGKTIMDIRDRAGPISFPKFVTEVDERVDDFLQKKQQTLSKDNFKYFAQKKVKGKKPNEGNVFMVFPDGNVRNVPRNEIKEVQRDGGVLLNGK